MYMKNDFLFTSMFNGFFFVSLKMSFYEFENQRIVFSLCKISHQFFGNFSIFLGKPLNQWKVMNQFAVAEIYFCPGKPPIVCGCT